MIDNSFYEYLSVASYWLMVLVWSIVFLFFARKYRQLKDEEPLLMAILVVLLMDAVRTLLENAYHGLIQAGQAGLLSPDLALALSRPELSFIPRITSLVLSFIVLAIIFRQNQAQGRVRQQRTQEIERLNEQLRQLAITDSLTGLYNHRRFQEALDHEVERSRRFGRSLSLLFMDIDHFKAVNDTFGHQVGDRALAQVAQVIRGNLRGIDTVARYGGEEFVVILPEAGASEALIVAERLRHRVAQHPFLLSPSGECSLITVSIGVTTYSSRILEANRLVAEADQAMYAAKAAGRNRVHLSPAATEG